MNKQKLPEGWKVMKLIDISESISAGGTPRRNIPEYWKDGNIPWIKISDMKNTYINKSEEKITEEGLKNSSTKLFPKRTLVYSIFATLGAIGILEIEATTNQAIAGIIPKKEVVDTKYLYYCLKSERNKIIAKKSHSTQDNINLGILRNHEIPLPPLETQKKIVSTLEKAEKAKEWRQEADDLTNDLLKSVFLEMFGDPVKNNKKWPIKELKDIASLERNPRIPQKIEKEDYYIGLEHIESHSGRILEKQKAKNLGLKSNKFVFDQECLLYGKLRPYLNKVALPNIRGVCSTDIIPIRPIKDISNKFFLAFLLRNNYVVGKATAASTGANLPRISPKSLESFKVYSPPIELQKQFASIVQEVEQMKENQKKSKQEIDNLFNSLMTKAFKGELEV